jgi:hypothetical protein
LGSPDSSPGEAFSNIPEGMNRALLKVFENYDLGDKSMLCLWRNGYLSSDLSRELELQARLTEWLKEKWVLFDAVETMVYMTATITFSAAVASFMSVSDTC